MHISYKICDITLKEEHLQFCIRIRTKENYLRELLRLSVNIKSFL